MQFVLRQRFFRAISTPPHRSIVDIDPTLESSQVTSARSTPISPATTNDWRRIAVAKPRRRKFGRTAYPM